MSQLWVDFLPSIKKERILALALGRKNLIKEANILFSEVQP